MPALNLTKHHARILRVWPKDGLRAITFHRSQRQRLSKQLPNATEDPQNIVQANEALVSLPAKLDTAAELQQINALYSLLENRYSKTYKTSSRLMTPAFNPSYYADLLAEMEAAPNRSWFQRQWLRWSKIIRFS